MKRAFAIALLLMLLVSALAGTLLISFSTANPYPSPDWAGVVPPRLDTVPPRISIKYPNSNTFLSNDWCVLSFNVYAPTGPDVRFPYIARIYYTTSWNKDIVFVLDNKPIIAKYGAGTLFDRGPSTFSGNLTLTGVPDGKQSVTVFAEYLAQYWYYIEPSSNNPFIDAGTYATFYITGSSAITFAIDTAAPRVSVLPLENAAYDGKTVPLSFRVTDQSVSWVGYSLDEKENVTVNGEALVHHSLPQSFSAWTGNLTLTKLPTGSHTLTVYAKDEIGHTGASDAIEFTVAQKTNAEPFPTTLIAVSVAVIVAIVSFGLVAYFLRRRSEG